MSAPLPEANDGRSIESVANQRGGGADEQQVLSEIDAEIADHLASAAADLLRRGRQPEEAKAMALGRFGNIASVRRRCWWIQLGDQIMFRWLAITLMSVMLVAVLTLAVGGWRVQTALANRLDTLTDELTSLHRAQEKLLDRESLETPKIEGQAYLGDASRPAAKAEVLIMNASNMKLFRRLWTDGEGRFRSNSLPQGDYFLLSRLLTADGREPLATAPPGTIGLLYYLQTQPLYVYPGTALDPLALDLRLDWGQISFEIVGPRTQQDAGGPPMNYRSQFVLRTLGPPPTLPVDPNGENIAKDWPLRGRNDNGPWSENNAKLAFGGSVDEPLRTYSMLLAGQYEAALVVVVFVDFDALDEETRKKSDWFQFQRQSYVGTVNYYPAYSQPKGFTAFKVTSGKRTHLRITIPEGLEARARELFAVEIKDFKAEADDAKAIERSLQPTPAAIEVIEDQALLHDKVSLSR